MISQNIRATSTPSYAFQGRIWNVSMSGTANISLSSIRANPSMEDPSKPTPLSRASSSSSTVIVKLFKNPRISVNHMLIYSIFRSFTIFKIRSRFGLLSAMICSLLKISQAAVLIMLIRFYWKPWDTRRISISPGDCKQIFVVVTGI